MRVAIIAVTHGPGYRGRLVPDLCRRLAAQGCEVEVLLPDEGCVDLARVVPEHDLYLLKSGTEMALSYAGALHARGARIVNPYPVTAVCRDKVVQTRILLEAGVPVPQTWATTDPTSLAPRLVEGPLILKTPRGSRGVGISVVRTAADLAALPAGTPWLAMRYHRPDGRDRKLYRIGDDVFGVERDFPPRGYEAKLGRPFAVPDQLREIVLRCGEPFGIGAYGVDVVFSDGRPWVVDMSAFPGFKGVPDAGSRLADYVLTHPLARVEQGLPR